MLIFGPPNVKKMEEKGDIERLIKAVEHNRPDVRVEAVQVLARLRNPRAVEPLFAFFQAIEKSGKYRVEKLEFATALAKLGDSRVLDYLTGFLSYTPGDEEGRRHQEKAYLAIRELGPIAFDHFKGMPDYEAVKSLGLSGDPRALDLLLAELKDISEEVPMRRRAAAFGLGWLGDARAVEPLIGALTDEDGNVRVNAAEALGLLGDRRAVVPLLTALAFGGSYQGHFTSATFIALARIGDPRTVNVIIAGQGRGMAYLAEKPAKKLLREMGGAEVERELARYKKRQDDL